MNETIQYFQSEIGKKIIALFVVSVLILVIGRLVKKTTSKYIESTETRYRTRRFIGFISYFLIIITVLIVFNNNLGGFTVFLGVAGAGITFAIQEVITSIAGFIAINFSNFYKVGDRIQLGGIKGDVIDVGFLRTSLMEIGDWVNGDLYNGRITRVANSFVFKEPVYNYSDKFPFLWDEIKVPIKTGGDFEWATREFYTILNEIQGSYIDSVLNHWNKMTETLMIEKAQVEPMVSLEFDENWTTFTLRYVVDYKKRRSTKDKISRKILDITLNPNAKISIANTSLEVTTQSSTK